jgi:hypothetical protein
MSLETAGVREHVRTELSMPRLLSARRVAFVLIALALFATAFLLTHWSVNGAAPVAALAVISEVFDKGF